MYSIWNNYSYNKKNKRVRFHNLIQMVLVPKVSELYDMTDIWWSERDKVNAYKSMYDEIQVLQKRHPSMTLKQAMKLLYQPNNLRHYDPSNFVK
jgi:regulatory protein YycI of two-component signal transduction system YycFG